MAERFYINSPLGVGAVQLDGPEARHLATVCRVRPGDEVRLFNGDGREYPARVTAVSKRDVTLEVVGVDVPARENGFRLELAVPLPKGDRAQFLVEKMTELGVTTFVPLQTARSVVHPRETKLEKLERYVIEASKQCGRNVLMRIEPMAYWAEYLSRANLPARRALAHPDGNALLSMRGDRAFAVGPEGGFTEEEVAAARSAGWDVVSLGPRILRVETAAMVLACGWMRQGERSV